MLTPVKVKRPDGAQKQTHGNTGKKNKKQIQIPSNLEHGNRMHHYELGISLLDAHGNLQKALILTSFYNEIIKIITLY